MKKLILIMGVAFSIFACESRMYEEISDNTPAPQVVKYNQDVQPVIDGNCVNCHSQGGSASYAPLTNYMEVKNKIDFIINRIQRPNGDPAKMPQGGSLSSSQISLIIKWKADGLVEN